MATVCIRVRCGSSAESEAASLVIIERMRMMFNEDQVYYRYHRGPECGNESLVFVYVTHSMNWLKRLLTVFRVKRVVRSKNYKNHAEVMWSLL